MEFPQAQWFSESKPKRTWNYCSRSSSTNGYGGQHYTHYYQHQPANHNQRQQYHHDITTQQDPYKTGYYKGGGSIHFGCVTLLLHQKKVLIHFEEWVGWLTVLTSCVGILPQGWRRQHMNWWVSYAFRPPLKVICHTNILYSGILIHWGQIKILWRVLG